MTAKECSEVTFFMVGCQRSGTTWTDAALREHPAIFLPESKQSYFFDRNYDKGMDWFMERFDGSDSTNTAIGEIATGYCLQHAVPLMAEHFPHVQLVMVMRNPIDRAYSNYQTRKTECGWASFEDALETDPEFLERGRYIEQTQALLKYYDREKILFLLYDDLHKDDRGYLKSILDFLGVDSSRESTLFGQRKNAALFPRLRKWLSAFGLNYFIKMTSRSSVGDWIRRSRKNQGNAYQPMKPETKEKLIEYFRPYNDQLSTLLQRDLSHWNGE
jgi:hypothetical protein